MVRKNELESLRKIAVRIGENSDSLPTIPITGFMAMVGNQYENDLMVVGRAVNGWTRGLRPQELHENENLKPFLDSVFESVTVGQTCPMQWVRSAGETMTMTIIRENLRSGVSLEKSLMN